MSPEAMNALRRILFPAGCTLARSLEKQPVRGHRDPQAPAVCKRRRDKPVAGIVSSSLVHGGTRLAPGPTAPRRECQLQSKITETDRQG